MMETLEVQREVLSEGIPGRELVIYRVGNWSFEDEDKDLVYIDQAIAAWTAWRAHVAKEQGE